MLNFLRKFGLEYCDLSTMVWNISVLLRTLTLNIDANYQRGTPVIYYVLTVIGAGCYFYVYLVSVVWFVFWRCIETGEVLAALLVFSLGTASEIGPVKLFYTMIHSAKVQNIVTTCLACDTFVAPGSRFFGNLHNNLRNVKKRAIVFWIIMMGNGMLYLIKPFVTPGRHLMEDDFIYYGLEPMQQTPNYEIAITVTVLGVIFACYTTVNITAFLIITVGYVEAQMLSWSEELEHLWDDAEHFHYENRIQITDEEHLTNDFSDPTIKAIATNTFIQSRLKEVLRSHARNVDLIQQIECVFKGAIAIEFFILIIGLIAELLGGLENTYMEVPFSFIQVAMDCVTGQRLIDASMVFERAVFHCRWENFDRANMKLVLMMLQSSQKTMTLSAGGLAKLNFSCLMSVVRSIYSAYTTLRSIMI